MPDKGAEGVVGGDVTRGEGDYFGGKCFQGGERCGVEGEVLPGAFWRGRARKVAIAAVGDGMRWCGFHNLASELGGLFAGVVE